MTIWTLGRSRRRAGPVGVIALAMATTLALAVPAAAAPSLTLDTGHIDAFAVAWENDELVLELAEDVTGSHVHHDPADVVLKVKQAESALLITEQIEAAFPDFGDIGDTVHYLPQTQNPQLIWPGLSTEEVPAGVFTNPLRVQVTDVQGPGGVSLWQTGSFGNTLSVLEGGGIQLPGTLLPNTGQHAHYNWVFTKPGTYSLTTVAGGTLVGGATKTSNTAVYTFQVGDAAAPTEHTLTINGAPSVWTLGQEVTLTHTLVPESDIAHYHWYTKDPGQETYTSVPGAGASYTFTVAEAMNGRQIVARWFPESGHDGAVESAPVTISLGGVVPGGDQQNISFTVPQSAACGGDILWEITDDGAVALSEAQLTGTFLQAGGTIDPIAITDSRTGVDNVSCGHAPFAIAGQVGNFVGDAGTIPGSYLGWTPTSTASFITPGAPVASGYEGSGPGLSQSSQLADVPGGTPGTGNAGADLDLRMPADVEAGSYQATLTLTGMT